MGIQAPSARPQLTVAATRRAAGHKLEGPSLVVDTREVQKDLDHVLFLRVAMPALGCDPFLALRVGDGVPVVYVARASLAPRVADHLARIPDGETKAARVERQIRNSLFSLRNWVRIAPTARASAAWVVLVSRPRPRSVASTNPETSTASFRPARTDPASRRDARRNGQRRRARPETTRLRGTNAGALAGSMSIAAAAVGDAPHDSDAPLARARSAPTRVVRVCGRRPFKRQGRRDSNPRPTVLETAALPTELRPSVPGELYRRFSRDPRAPGRPRWRGAVRSLSRAPGTAGCPSAPRRAARRRARGTPATSATRAAHALRRRRGSAPRRPAAGGSRLRRRAA